MASSYITSRQIEGEKEKEITDFIFLGSKITADGKCSHDIKRRVFPGRKNMTNLDTGSWEKKESSRKTSISAFSTMPKPLTVWITINCGKF